MIEIGFHTDAFNSAYWSFEQCLQWAQRNDVHWIECGTINGVSWLHGLGYQPHVSLTEDPLALREKMEKYGVRFSQLDAAYPLSLPNASYLGLTYILNSMRWAYLVGCDHIDTTDHMHKPAGQTDEAALESMKRIYGEVLEAANDWLTSLTWTWLTLCLNRSRKATGSCPAMKVLPVSKFMRRWGESLKANIRSMNSGLVV